MNEDLTKRITSYLDAVEQSASKAGEFISEQTPLLAQEYLAWEYWSNAICMPFIALAAIAVGILVAWMVRASKDASCMDREIALHGATVIGGLAFPVCALLFGVCLMNAAKVVIAPRVVLMEAVKELAK
jgi:hypothetical protein